MSARRWIWLDGEAAAVPLPFTPGEDYPVVPVVDLIPEDAFLAWQDTPSSVVDGVAAMLWWQHASSNSEREDREARLRGASDSFDWPFVDRMRRPIRKPERYEQLGRPATRIEAFNWWGRT